MMDNIYMLKMYLSSIKIINDEQDFYLAYSMLSKERKQKVEKLKSYRAKCLCAISELLLKKALEELNIDSHIRYSYNEFKKPYLKDHPEIYFNYSHSKEYVVCVISNNEVGCDIEYIDKLNEKLYKRFFSENEIDYLDSLENNKKRESFYKLWTLKESYIKYIGKGFSCSLNSFNVLDFKELECCFYDIDVNKNYKCSVCSAFNEQIEVYSILRENLLL